MKLLRTLTLLWSDDDDALDKVLDVDKHGQTVDNAAIAAESSSNIMIVAANAVDAAVPFGPVTTAHRIFLAVDRTVTVKLNGGSESFTIKPLVEGTTERTERGVFYWEGVCTAIQISNAAASAAKIVFGLAGV